MDRRSFLQLAGGAALLGGSGCRTATIPVNEGLGNQVTLWSWFDLPADPRSRELSGICWDAIDKRFYAVQDEASTIVEIRPDAELKTFVLGRAMRVEVDGPLDLEGIVMVKDGFIVASEAGPRVLCLDRFARLQKEIFLPPMLSEAIKNKSVESLGLSPDGRYLFTTSEAALPRDGAAASTAGGTRVRLVRIDRETGLTEEHAYTTDAISYVGGDYGVADVCAIDGENLLVLERGWARQVGSTVRIYRVNLGDSKSVCQLTPTLDDLTPMLEKTLFCDFARLPVPANVPAAKQPHKTALLDNFEGMCLGPRLPDGRRSIVVCADDNGRSDQNPRILVLAVS